MLSLCFQTPALPKIGEAAPSFDILGALIALHPPWVPGTLVHPWKPLP